VGIGAAFVFGLCMDVHQSSMLGQHALSYTTLGFFAITIHRRLLWYPVASQALQVLPLFALSQLIEVVTRMIGGGVFPGWTVLASPAIEAALWPLATALLLAPQRRTPEPDENRPL
jgi:rod shape-determining protein MreD